MRTIKRQTLTLNPRKLETIKKLVIAYGREKRHWLDHLRSWDNQARLDKYREVRDELVQAKYQSRNGLQARHWKLGLQDAHETWDKYWQAIFVKVRSRIAKRSLSENERRYAYLLLKRYDLFSLMMQGKAPEVNFELSHEVRHTIASSIQRLIKKFKGKAPAVKIMRSVVFDANCYEVVKQRGRQYLKLMSQDRGKRITIPLQGTTAIRGNIRLVLVQDRVEIHITEEILSPEAPKEEVIEAVDFGYSEVMTDTQGIRYGQNLGAILTKASDAMKEKMQKRHRLHALEKKLRITNPKKAARIRKYNLGRTQLNHDKRRVQATLEREINQGIHQLIESKNPSVLVTEDLRHEFTFDKPKKVNRRLSNWTRGKIQDRIEFKALAKGFRLNQVNPAYGSQTCLCCDFVDRENRNGDLFKCLHCGYEDKSDRVAAMNYRRRYDDPEIDRHTPCRDVKIILLNRFHRRLEVGQPTTVPGRTLDTAQDVNPPCLFEKLFTAGREKSRFDRAVNQRAKHNEHV